MRFSRFAQANDLPVACGFRRQDLIDNEHRCYIGDIAIGPNPALVEHIRSLSEIRAAAMAKR